MVFYVYFLLLIIFYLFKPHVSVMSIHVVLD